MDLNLNGKRALVSGGSHGIGLAIAKGLAQEGCRVTIFSRTERRVKSAVKELRCYSNENDGLICDVLDTTQVEYLMKVVRDNDYDILINNVGGGGRWGKGLLNSDRKVWKEVYQKNTGIAIDLTLEVLPKMISNQWGRIITITSIYGLMGGGKPWFNVAKAAETTLMKNLAMNHEIAGAGITVNSVAPGAVMIPNTGWEEMEKERPQEFTELIGKLPLGRMGSPEEVANLVVFLCSPLASYINGSSILIDGGETSII